MQAAREIAAAVSALFAYLTTVLPRVRQELRQLGPLPEEKARNAEAVAVFATLAPRRRRAAVVRAIVALQVEIDLRDELEESGEGTGDGRLDQLAARWRQEVAALPAHETVRSRLDGAIERCQQGQLQTHRAAREGSTALRVWAEGLGASSEYRWWEVAAGASSSVAAHALIAAAADPATTTEDTAAIDAAYNPPIGALTVLLDDLVDLAEDHAGGEHTYISYYEGPSEMAGRLSWIAARSDELTIPLPCSGRHRAILAGVAAFYLSAQEAKTDFARPVRARLLSSMGRGTSLLAAFIGVRRQGERRRSEQAGNPPGP
jgi:tetraprenyl-beta-curcumene synthase